MLDEDYYKLINGKTKQSIDEEVYAQETIDLHDKILSIIDDDIAKIFRAIGHGRYPDQLPLLAQIARNLRVIVVDSISNPNIKVGQSH